MKQKETPWFKLLGYDSSEEVYFLYYLNDLVEAGYIDKFEYHPIAYDLSPTIRMQYDKRLKTKVNTITKEFIHSHIFTIDYRIYWNWKAKGVFFDDYMMYGNTMHINNKDIAFIAEKKSNLEFEGYLYYSDVDVKGSFAGMNNTSAVTFPINQKWVFDKFGIYVNKTIPEKLFLKTFTPSRYFYGDENATRERRKKVNGHLVPLSTIKTYKTLKTYLNSGLILDEEE